MEAWRSEPFRPAAGLSSPHAQTIFARFARSARVPPLRRERWELDDGDFLDADVLPGGPDTPWILVLHGLEGSSSAGYVSSILRGAHRRGWGAVALNFRSCGGEPNRLPRFYHSGEIGDVAEALRRLRPRTTGPLLGVGFSLGGNVLLRHLQEEGESSPLHAAAAISVPFDLAVCAEAIDRGRGVVSIYRSLFLRSLRSKALEKARCHPGSLDPDAIERARGIVEFDDAVTAPLHGFPSARAYYEASSSGPRLAEIRRPTLCISAADDPMVPASCLPRAGSPLVSMCVTPNGGHVGFVGGSLPRPRFWAEAEALRFLEGSVGSLR
ncbi:MAG TPA: alpha/beta fold hydrolase [Vulgatibacter sp.]|nr:alpha/beta fold hydrolase [Vulgatibacter sp.]